MAGATAPSSYAGGYTGKYADLINAAARATGLDPWRLAAVLQAESSMNPLASSGVADGIAQINRSAHPDVTLAQARDPRFAIPWAAHYLASLKRQEGGSWTRALQRYNGSLGTPAGAAYVRQVNAALSGLRGVAGNVADQAMQFARSAIGTPYVWGGETKSGGFDCSGLIQWAFEKAGINLPRTTYDQFKAGTSVGWKDLKPGDLVFSNWEGGSSPTHVVLYIGNGQVIAAPHTGAKVQVEPLSLFKSTFVGARRVTGPGTTTSASKQTSSAGGGGVGHWLLDQLGLGDAAYVGLWLAFMLLGFLLIFIGINRLFGGAPMRAARTAAEAGAVAA